MLLYSLIGVFVKNLITLNAFCCGFVYDVSHRVYITCTFKNPVYPYSLNNVRTNQPLSRQTGYVTNLLKQTINKYVLSFCNFLSSYFYKLQTDQMRFILLKHMFSDNLLTKEDISVAVLYNCTQCRHKGSYKDVNVAFQDMPCLFWGNVLSKRLLLRQSYHSSLIFSCFCVHPQNKCTVLSEEYFLFCSFSTPFWHSKLECCLHKLVFSFYTID